MKTFLLFLMVLQPVIGFAQSAVELKTSDGRPLPGSIIRTLPEALRMKRAADGVVVDVPWTKLDREQAWRLSAPLFVREDDEPDKHRVTLNLKEQIPLSPQVVLRPSVVMIGPFRQKDGVVLSFDRNADALGWQRYHPVMITVDGRGFDYEGSYDGDSVGSGVNECVSIRITMEDMSVICRGQKIEIKVGPYAFNLDGNRLVKLGALLAAWQAKAAAN